MGKSMTLRTACSRSGVSSLGCVAAKAGGEVLIVADYVAVPIPVGLPICQEWS